MCCHNPFNLDEAAGGGAFTFYETVCAAPLCTE